MTDKNSTEAGQNAEQGGGDFFNTAAGWVLFAAGLGLGLSILSGKYFHGTDPERPEQLGFVIEGVVEEGGAAVAEMTMAEALSLTTVEAGEKVYAKCAACHSIEAGGANGIGPNLHGAMGSNVAAHAGYSYSSALSAKGGQWGWEEMNLWLKNPKAYVDGTKMGFAGLSKIEDRAAVALYLNSQGENLPVPAFTPADVETPAEEAAEGEEVPVAEDAVGAITEAAES